mmetsp:Transcript_19961/g.60589  ORF Transcript_19961/g.60589 Transcript_19961/m.60589 type:complete len:308 (-) Transcript_19961:228-1151(-)
MMSMLLGMAAARRGSAHPALAQMLCLHIPALHPPSFTELELEVPALVQISALLSVGLLYQASRLATHATLPLGHAPKVARVRAPVYRSVRLTDATSPWMIVGDGPPPDDRGDAWRDCSAAHQRAARLPRVVLARRWPLPWLHRAWSGLRCCWPGRSPCGGHAWRIYPWPRARPKRAVREYFARSTYILWWQLARFVDRSSVLPDPRRPARERGRDSRRSDTRIGAHLRKDGECVRGGPARSAEDNPRAALHPPGPYPSQGSSSQSHPVARHSADFSMAGIAAHAIRRRGEQPGVGRCGKVVGVDSLE